MHVRRPKLLPGLGRQRHVAGHHLVRVAGWLRRDSRHVALAAPTGAGAAMDAPGDGAGHLDLVVLLLRSTLQTNTRQQVVVRQAAARPHQTTQVAQHVVRVGRQSGCGGLGGEVVVKHRPGGDGLLEFLRVEQLEEIGEGRGRGRAVGEGLAGGEGGGGRSEGVGR